VKLALRQVHPLMEALVYLLPSQREPFDALVLRHSLQQFSERCRKHASRTLSRVECLWDCAIAQVADELGLAAGPASPVRLGTLPTGRGRRCSLEIGKVMQRPCLQRFNVSRKPVSAIDCASATWWRGHQHVRAPIVCPPPTRRGSVREFALCSTL
jgi:hypothetical protein